MRFDAEIDGRRHEVVIERDRGALTAALDGRPVPLDARPLEGFFLSLLIDGRAYEVTVEPDGDDWKVQVGIAAHRVTFLDPLRLAADEDDGARHGTGKGGTGRSTAASLMPGKVVRVLVKVGDEVAEGQDLLVVEAMKMENSVTAPRAGRVVEVKVAAGEAVEAGVPLAVVG